MSEAVKAPVAVVTGASAGIGLATARMLAGAGWRVIGVGRDLARCTAAEAQIRAAAVPGAAVDFVRADFTEMAEVRRVAREIAALTPKITVLVNNAGGIRNGLYRTSEGLEATFAANHLAPFLLTRELLPALEATAAESAAGTVRVIAVSSLGHAGCPGMNWDDLNLLRGGFTPSGAYCQAKLANLLFTRELDRRIAPRGLVAQAMHPGMVDSNFLSHANEALRRHREVTEGYVSPDVPAKTLVWLATAPEAGQGGGRYFHDGAEVQPAPQALDDAAAARLWAESEAILGGIGV